MKNILFILITILLATACSISSEKEDAVISIKVETANHTLKLSSFFKKISYIPLDAPNDSFLIGNINKIKVVNDEVFILTSRKLLSYDANDGNGNFYLRKNGKAPDEYISISDIWVDEFVEILDTNAKRIKRYDRKGNFLCDILIPSNAFSFHKLDSVNYILYNNNMLTDNNQHKLTFFNSATQNIEKKHFPIDKNIANYFFVRETSNFSSYSGVISFFSNPEHIIYTNRNQELEAKYKLDFGKHTIPKTFFDTEFSDIAEFSKEAYKRGYIYFVNNLCENAQYIIFSFMAGEDRKSHLSIFNKSNLKDQTGTHILDDITFPGGKYKLIPNYCFTADAENFYFVIQPDVFIEMTNQCKSEWGDVVYQDFLNNNDNIRRIIDSPDFNEQSNPILVVCEF